MGRSEIDKLWEEMRNDPWWIKLKRWWRISLPMQWIAWKEEAGTILKKLLYGRNSI
jgi:hypothetical protein